MTWTSDGLKLGSGTRLACTVRGEEARLLALLSVMANKACPVEALETIKRAEVEFRAGKLAKSAMRLALANSPPLAGLDDAYRLYAAAALIDQSLLTPADLVRACEIDCTHVEALAKYSPDQPRAPAGNSDGGQWVRGTVGGAGPTARKPKTHEKPIQTSIVLPEGCDEEWDYALKYCAKLLEMDDPPRSLTGGHTTTVGCARGFVSERCGGNPIG
jgi:hypothetical protein